MRCPMCDEPSSQVIDTRPTSDGVALRRRRQCGKCGQRFTTYERREPLALMVRKRDGRVEPFEARKVRLGIEKACSKRAMSPEQITEMARSVEEEVRGPGLREVSADQIARIAMATLRQVDEVAYVRFASIHEDFQDAGLFVDAVETLTKQSKPS